MIKALCVDDHAIGMDNLTEGNAALMMHIRSYDEEAPTLVRLHTEHLPQKMKFFLRQPVALADGS